MYFIFCLPFPGALQREQQAQSGVERFRALRTCIFVFFHSQTPCSVFVYTYIYIYVNPSYHTTHTTRCHYIIYIYCVPPLVLGWGLLVRWRGPSAPLGGCWLVVCWCYVYSCTSLISHNSYFCNAGALHREQRAQSEVERLGAALNLVLFDYSHTLQRVSITLCYHDLISKIFGLPFPGALQREQQAQSEVERLRAALTGQMTSASNELQLTQRRLVETERMANTYKVIYIYNTYIDICLHTYIYICIYI